MEKQSVYEEHGYENRTDYLHCLADDYDADVEIVRDLADILGKEEGFDGLISALEDIGERQY